MTTKTDRIFEYVIDHPGQTNTEIAKALALDPTQVAALTGQMCKPMASGKPRLRREPHPTQVAKNKTQPVYILFPNDTTAAARERERKAIRAERATEATHAKRAQPSLTLDGLIDGIAKQIANRIAASVGKHLVVQLSTVIPECPEQQFDLVEYLKDAIVPPQEQAKSKPVARQARVTICGLLPQQAGLISQEYGQAYDLSFWNEEGTDKLKALAKNADHIITFSSKLPHHVENTIRSVNRDFKRVMGGLTELRRVLTNLGEGA